MHHQTVHIVSQAIHYIEEHLHDNLDLDMVAIALHYSKYHLHRIFTKTVGLTIHDYIKRRQLTEAAKFLAFSKNPLLKLPFYVDIKASRHFQTYLKQCIKRLLQNFGN